MYPKAFNYRIRPSTTEGNLLDHNKCNQYNTIHLCYREWTIEKRASAIEEGISSILKALTDNIEHEFVEKNFVSLLYEFMHYIKKGYIKKGSTKMMEQATQIVGLLAMITSCVDKAHEAYEDVKALVSQEGLKSKLQLKNLKILDCLAVVTFFGASDSDETEQAMQLLWKFIHLESDSRMGSEHSTPVLTAAICAWSFLLTTLDGWRLSYKWQGAISCFSNLLDHNDETVCAAASEALALIFETNCLEKFSTEAKDTQGSIPDGVTSINVHSRKELKDNITKQLRSRSKKPSTGKCTYMPTQDTGTASDAILAALNFLEEGNCRNAYEIIDGKELKLSTWSQMIQLKFMKHFLGKDGFVNHMRKNENLHNVFEFKPKSYSSDSHRTLYVAEREEAAIRFFLPPAARSQNPPIGRKERQLKKKMTKSPSSPLSKARTMLLKKQRELSSEMQGRNNGCFADDSSLVE